MRIALALILALVFSPFSQAKDYFIRLGDQANVVLTDTPCHMEWLTGPGWQRSRYQVVATSGVFTNYKGCWRRFGDKLYVLDDVAPFWFGRLTFYHLDSRPCSFHVPGISFAGWRNGREIGVSKLPATLTANVSVLDYGPICWRSNGNWFDEINAPSVYSAFEAKASSLP